MNPPTTPPGNATPVDEDLAEQARPGHGIPSQDPNPAAQFALEPEEAEREAKSVLVGGGVVAGAVAGAAIGVLLAGPGGGRRRHHTGCGRRRCGWQSRKRHFEPAGFGRCRHSNLRRRAQAHQRQPWRRPRCFVTCRSGPVRFCYLFFAFRQTAKSSFDFCSVGG